MSYETIVSRGKYDFPTFIDAFWDSNGEYSFDNPDPSWVRHWRDKLKSFLEQDNFGNVYHNGDCIKQPCTCGLCMLEENLSLFKEYTFNEETFRKERLED